jgi:aspartyl-tRNA(Asn)/glutamyl-tRNA(Gln) amidotransferase subunit A
MPDLPIPFRSATELGRLIRSKKISSVELTRLYLERLEKQGVALNALAHLTREVALQQAKQADAEIAQGKVRSPLHGVPYGAKDLLATKGIPTEWGSPAHKGQVFEYDATVVARLREAGTVLVGKLAMVELAGGGGYEYASASSSGGAKCPWGTDRWAGGSSSGSGAGVGAGAVGFAIGTETWGSITVPAAFCGITGLRPTYGRVSRHGAMALSWTMDKVGAMARSAEDCGHILQIIAGVDPLDDTSAREKFAFRPRAFSSLPRPIRLGVLPHDYSKVSEVKRVFDGALEVFRKGSFVMKEAKYPTNIPYDAAANLIIMAEGSAAFENLIRDGKLNALVDTAQQAGMIAGLSVTAVDYLRALRIRTEARAAISKLWNDFDALIAPTLLLEATPINKGLSEITEPWGGNGGAGNLVGLPSISVPMGFGKTGLPLGLELVGAPFQEQKILALAQYFQQETNWHQQIPKI